MAAATARAKHPSLRRTARNGGLIKEHSRELYRVVQGEREAAEALLREKFDTSSHRQHAGWPRRDDGSAWHLTRERWSWGANACSLRRAPLDIRRPGAIVWAKSERRTNLLWRRISSSVDAVSAARCGGDETGAARVLRRESQKSPTTAASSTGSTWIGLRATWAPVSLPAAASTMRTLSTSRDDSDRCPTDAPVMQEEIFGPILPVLEFAALDERWRCCATDRRHWRSTFSARTARPRNVCWAPRARRGCPQRHPHHMLGKDLPFAVWATAAWAPTTAARLRLFHSSALGSAPVARADLKLLFPPPPSRWRLEARVPVSAGRMTRSSGLPVGMSVNLQSARRRLEELPVPKRVLIIGAGPWWVWPRDVAGQSGLEVTGAGEATRVGGRTSAIEGDGYRFDLGPTFFLYRKFCRRFSNLGRDCSRKADDRLDRNTG